MLYHASGEIVEFPEIRKSRYTDDNVWNFVNDFLAGEISRHIFGELARFKHPTHQISFHILKALECLQFERGEVVND